jgi:hypothetical protein
MKNLVKKFFVFFVLVGMFGGVAAELSETDKRKYDAVLAIARRTDATQIQIQNSLSEINILILLDEPNAPTTKQKELLKTAKQTLKEKLPRARRPSVSGPSSGPYGPSQPQYGGQPAVAPVAASPQAAALLISQIRRTIRTLTTQELPTDDDGIDALINSLNTLALPVSQQTDSTLITAFNTLLAMLKGKNPHQDIIDTINEIQLKYRLGAPAAASAGAGAAVTIQTLRGKIGAGYQKIAAAIKTLEKVRDNMPPHLGIFTGTPLNPTARDEAIRVIDELKKRLHAKNLKKTYQSVLESAETQIQTSTTDHPELYRNTNYTSAVKVFLQESRLKSKIFGEVGFEAEARSGIFTSGRKDLWYVLIQNPAVKTIIVTNNWFTEPWYQDAILHKINVQKRALHAGTEEAKYAELVGTVWEIIDKNREYSENTLVPDFSKAVIDFTKEALKKANTPAKQAALKAPLSNMQINANQLYAEIKETTVILNFLIAHGIEPNER